MSPCRSVRRLHGNCRKARFVRALRGSPPGVAAATMALCYVFQGSDVVMSYSPPRIGLSIDASFLSGALRARALPRARGAATPAIGDMWQHRCRSSDDNLWSAAFVMSARSFGEYVSMAATPSGGTAIAAATAAASAGGDTVRALAEEAEAVWTHEVGGLAIAARGLPGGFVVVLVTAAGRVGARALLLAKLRLVTAALQFTCGPVAAWVDDLPDFDAAAGAIVGELLAAEDVRDEEDEGETVASPTAQSGSPMAGAVASFEASGQFRAGQPLRARLVGLVEGSARALLAPAVRAKLVALLTRLTERTDVSSALLALSDGGTVLASTMDKTNTAMIDTLMRARPLEYRSQRITPVYSRGAWRQLVEVRTRVGVLAMLAHIEKRVREYEEGVAELMEALDEQLPTLLTEELPLFVHNLTRHDGVLVAVVKDIKSGITIVPQPRPIGTAATTAAGRAFQVLFSQARAALRGDSHFAVADHAGSASALVGPHGDEDSAAKAAIPMTRGLSLRHGDGYSMAVMVDAKRETYVLFGAPVDATTAEDVVAEIEDAAVSRFGLD